MKVYISGPMTSIEGGNRTAFGVAAKKLFLAGHESVNPVNVGRRLEYKLKRKPTWEEYMRADIKALMDCDGILMLENWLQSDGAKLEFQLSEELGMERITLERNDNGNEKSL